MADESTRTENRGFRPITEGYQPGAQILQKGYVPTVAESTRPPSPPSGGSSVSKPPSPASSSKG